MVVQVPSPPATEREADVDAGVIDDARRRQRLHRRVGVSLLVLVAAGALLAGIAAGGGGAGGGRGGGGGRAEPSGSGPGSGAALASARTAFPGAPTTQRNGFGVETLTCPLAAPNPYLPARAGCVFVRRVRMTGDGGRDLVIVYSILSHRHPSWFNGPVPAQLAKRFVPLRAYLTVILPNGTRIAARIPRTRTAALGFVTHIAGASGDEVFIDVGQDSSGSTYAAYGLHGGHLIPAGVLLASGGDAAAGMRFNCLPGTPPRLMTRTFILIGPTIYGSWRETRTVYEWHDAWLVEISQRTLIHHGAVNASPGALRNGCQRVSG